MLFLYIWRVNWRWYFPLSIIFLAFLGIGMEQSAAPNQEIVVQFNGVSNNSKSAQQTIAEITDRLQTLGVTHIQVTQIQSGTLKVTYFSKVDLAVVQTMLDGQQKKQSGRFAVSDNGDIPRIPSKDKTNDTYIFKLLKIEKDFNSDFGFQGLPVQIKTLKDQYLNPYVSINTVDFIFKKNLKNSRSTFFNYETLLFNVSSCQIPEVRAGPIV